MTRRRPLLLVLVELEERPYPRILTDSAEDEERLRAWLACPAARRRLLADVEDAVEKLMQAEA